MKFFMTVILLRMNSIYLLFITIFFITNNSYAQLDCNKKTLFKKDSLGVPAEVCIPDDYFISYVYSRYKQIDFNKDGLSDYVFIIEKQNKSVGDSLILYFYKMNLDSSHTFVKSFANVFPVFFNPHEFFPRFDEKYLEELFDCYQSPNPLYLLTIENDTIVLERSLDGHHSIRYQYIYKFHPSLGDWKLIKSTRIQPGGNIEKKNIGDQLLSDFSYCEF